MGLYDYALRTISVSAHTIHKRAQLVSKLDVTIVRKFGADTVGNRDTWIKYQNLHNLQFLE
jgi:hypothetical protein